MSVGGGKSNSSNQSAFSQSIPGFQSSALTSLYNSAQSLFGSTNNQTSAAQPGAQNIVSGAANSALPALQSNLQGGAYAGLGAGNTLMQSLMQSLNSPSATQQVYSSIMGGNGNSYAPALNASMETQAQNAKNMNMQTTAAQAAADGQSGSSGQGVAQALGNQFIDQNLQANEAQTGYNAYNTDLQNKLGIAQQADSNTLSRQQLLQQLLGQQQGTIDNGINQASGVQNLGMGTLAPSSAQWGNLGNWASALGSPTVLSSGSGSGNSKGKTAAAGLGK